VLAWNGGEVTSRRAGGFDIIWAQACRIGGASGEPALPVYPFHYRVPSDARVLGFRVLNEQWKTMGRGYLPLPVQDAVRAGQAPRFRLPEGNGYRGGSWYPSEAVEYAGGGYMRGRRIEGFLVRPVRYDAQEGELQYLKRLEIEVDLIGGGSPPIEVKRALRPVEDGFDELLSRLVRAEVGSSYSEWLGRKGVNLQRGSGLKGGFVPSTLPQTGGSPVEYVIVTSERLKPEFETLAEWKTAKGVRAVVRTVEWIEANYPRGSDLAETIRFFLRDAYANWGTEWVLLGGDTDVVPIRYVKNTFNGPGAEIPTDLYYSCLDGDWNDDGDESFGEGYSPVAAGDSVDLYPDLFIGRAPANTPQEAATFVDKVLRYERWPSVRDAARAIFFTEVIFPADWQGEPPEFDGCVFAESAENYLPPTMEVVKLYENTGNAACPGGVEMTKEGVLDSLNSGFGIANHVGHGYINVMSVGSDVLRIEDAFGLTNSHMPTFMLAPNCDAGAVDYNCIAESFLFNPNGGASGFLGYAREDYPHTSKVYEDEWYKVVFSQGVSNAGKAHALSRVPFVPLCATDGVDRWTQMVNILLGDPEMPLWSARPESLTVSHSPQMELGSTSFDVTVYGGGSPIESVLVALEKTGDEYKVGFTNSFGVAALPFSPDSVGSFTVTATKRNYLPYCDSVTVAPTAQPHLRVAWTIVDDDDAGASSGNGDGFIDRGETVELFLPLMNHGEGTAFDVHGMISTSDGMVTIQQTGSDHGTIAPGDTSKGTGYRLIVSPRAPDRHLVTLHAALTSSSGSWQDDVVIELRAPDIELYMSAKDDSVGIGDGDGLVDPNEDVELYITLRNNGTGVASGLSAILRAADSGASVTDSTAGYGDLCPGFPTVGDHMAFRNGGSANPVFDLLIRDSYGTLDSLKIDMAPPETLLTLTGSGGAYSVVLKWAPSNAVDLRGYNVYRSSSQSGPFLRINNYTVESGSRYEDAGLAPLTVFYYRVAAQDTSGNEGALSPVSEVSTTPPLVNGWPVGVESESSSSPVLADIDLDGDLEMCFGAEEIYVLHHDGSEFIDGDNDVATHGVFSNVDLGGSRGFWSSPAVGDIDNDGIVEIVASHMDGSKIFVWKSDGTVAAGWPKYVGQLPWSSPALGDIDGDSDLEIVTASGSKYLYAWNPDGTEVMDGDSNPGTNGVFAVMRTTANYGSAALADLDGDGIAEIVFGGRDGYLYVWRGDGTSYGSAFPKYLPGRVVTTPAIADVDGDGELEIVVAAGDQNTDDLYRRVHVVNLDGSEVPGWPRAAGLRTDTGSSPALGDVDKNGVLDVVVGDADGVLHVWEGSTAEYLPGWPVRTEAGMTGVSGGYIRSGPTLVDIDNDLYVEILFGDEGGRVYAYNHDGTPLAGFPIKTGGYVRGSVGAWDFDGDGGVELFAQSQDHNVYAWKYSWGFLPSSDTAPWPFFKHDARRTSLFNWDPLTWVDPPRKSPLVVANNLEQNYPNPFYLSTTIFYHVPAPGARVSLEIFDAEGRLVRVLVDGWLHGGRQDAIWDARDNRGRVVPSGLYFYRLDVGGRSWHKRMAVVR
jgi:hypothetical protein